RTTTPPPRWLPSGRSNVLALFGRCLADFAGPNVAVSGDEALPRAKGMCEVEKDAVVCADAKISGPGGVKFGEGTVVHPACVISAKVGPIIFGSFNVIEEQVEITNTSEEPLVIGDHNIFEVGARILGGGGRRIGDANVFECRATLDPGCSVGSGCTLGVGASLTEGESLPDETVVVGPPGMRHTERGAKEANTQAHTQAVLNYIEVLKETLPRCHHLRKSQPKTEC
ncbi:unnamed protein product, partial [Polarella glacialis]